MTVQNAITILVAEDNDISRDLITAILRTRGYQTIDAIDGQSAIEIVKNNRVDLALVDINMTPKGGFQFVEHLIAQGIDIPVVIITADDSSDVLMRASSLDVIQVIQKPVEPKRLLQTVSRILKRRGLNPDPLAVEEHDTQFSHEDIMDKVFEMAKRNVKLGRGRPFSAIVTDKNGRILGEGVNGITSRADPTAHAEVMAIRQASERLDKADLSECILYCSSEPTMIGQALIISVSIPQVYYGLSHDEIKALRADDLKVREKLGNQTHKTPTYTQICHDKAKATFSTLMKKS